MEIQNEKDVVNYYLTQIIKNLKKNGVDDITTEAVYYQRGNNTLRVRFHTKEQWCVDSNKANTAQLLMKQHYKGYKMPFTVVSYEDVEYYVENLSRGK